MTRILLSAALLVTACSAEPAIVGETLIDTEDSTSGDAGSGTGAAQTTAPSTDGTSDSTPEDDDAPEPPEPLDCPDAEYTTCQDATRSLVQMSFNAVTTRRDQYEGALMVLTAELGLTQPASNAALALALEAAGLGSLGTRGEGSCSDSIPPAAAFIEQCEGAPPVGAFGCQGVCTLEPSHTAACVAQGRIRCFSPNQACSGLCVGGCSDGPAACEEICSGTCEGSCPCAQDGFCFGPCSGTCNGSCIGAEPVACAGTCMGLCEYETVDTPECSPELLLECVDGGAGSCASNCRGVPTAPADVDSCCGPLIGFAALLATSCSGPPLVELGCGTQPDTDDGLSIALESVLSVRAELQRTEAEFPALQSAIAQNAAAAPPGSCEAEAWEVEQQTVTLALSELSDLLSEIDSLHGALFGG